MTDKELISKLTTLTNHEVFFGPQGFNNVTTVDELNEAQLGFGVSELGQSGPSWAVIFKYQYWHLIGFLKYKDIP